MPIPPSGDRSRWSAKARRGEKRAVDRAATPCGGHSTRVGRHGAGNCLGNRDGRPQSLRKVAPTWPSVVLSRRAVDPIALRGPSHARGGVAHIVRDEGRRCRSWHFNQRPVGEGRRIRADCMKTLCRARSRISEAGSFERERAYGCEHYNGRRGHSSGARHRRMDSRREADRHLSADRRFHRDRRDQRYSHAPRALARPLPEYR